MNLDPEGHAGYTFVQLLFFVASGLIESWTRNRCERFAPARGTALVEDRAIASPVDAGMDLFLIRCYS